MSKAITGPRIVNQLQKILGSTRIIWIDKYLGLRAWGLILYGILPSNLAFIGMLDVELPDTSKLSPILILMASVIPLIFVFSLVSYQNKKWYLTEEKIYSRSFTITFLIVLFSTLIIGISGVIQNKYFLCIPAWDFRINKASAECFLSAISCLVISSSIFILALTQNADFPLLPSVSFAESIDEINRNIRDIQNHEIWKNYVVFDPFLIDLIIAAETKINNIIVSKGNSLAKIVLTNVYEDLGYLNKTLERIWRCKSEESQRDLWEIYFGDFEKLTEYQKKIRKKYIVFDSLQEIINLDLGD